MTQIKYLKGKYFQKKGKVELILVKCTQSISTVLVASCNMVLNQFCIGCLCNVNKRIMATALFSLQEMHLIGLCDIENDMFHCPVR